tara:strand:+ start:2567 stop:3088 length:522 start_codon:yes stop_codon:yes gene_type:complete
MIRCDASALINYVYYFRSLGIHDYLIVYTNKFKLIYNNKNKIKKYEYRNKIYGMTHFIIAGSNYYQNYVDYTEYKWIINYFKKNINEILKRTTIDIIVEVGICLYLVKLFDNELINLITNKLIQNYDINNYLIKPKNKSNDLNKNEHTSILILMFFNWNKNTILTKGPILFNN